RVYATWAPHTNRASNAQYSVLDGLTPLAPPAPVNQKLAPSGISDQGATWQLLGDFDITGSLLRVSLGGPANGNLNADAIRVEPVLAPPTGVILDNGDPGYTQGAGWTTWTGFGFQGDVAELVPGGAGVASWSFSSLAPGAYRVFATWAPHTNRA